MKPTTAALASCLLLAPAVARAGEGESAASLSLGGATWWAPADDPMTPDVQESIGPTGGAALAVEYERGISEALSWRVAAGGGGFGGDGWSGAGWVTGGLVYRFDVLKYVPYAVGGVGGLIVGGEPLDEVVLDPALEIGLGIDWLLGRDRSWGLEARAVTFPDDMLIVTLGVRRTHRWGFF